MNEDDDPVWVDLDDEDQAVRIVENLDKVWDDPEVLNLYESVREVDVRNDTTGLEKLRAVSYCSSCLC